MANTFNSVSGLIDQALEMQQQALETLAKITESLTTAQESIKIDYLSNGNTQEFEIPSFGFIKTEIKRIDENLKLLMGYQSGEINLRLPDGSYKRLYSLDILKTPESLNGLPVPSIFNTKNNWFFESFLNPLLYVSFDITEKINNNIEKVIQKRIVINDRDAKVREFFDENLKNKNDIDHDTLFDTLESKGISWFIDEETINLPVNNIRYYGNFDVIDIKDEIDSSNIKVRNYKLNKLTYNDHSDIINDTVTLKVGDQLISGENSKYEITSVNSSKNSITVKRISGYESMKIGADTIRFYSELSLKKEIQVNVGHEERQILFFKPIDRRYNLSSLAWSPGVAFYSSDLLTSKGDKNLHNFYEEVVTDFGSYFLSIAKEKIIPAILGLTPTAPQVLADNFKVVQINKHKLDAKENAEILKKGSEKIALQSELNQLNISIGKKKEELGIKKFVDDTERNTVKNELENLIKEKISKSNLYSTMVNELISVGKSSPDTLDTPKYRIRGFWPIPASLYHEKTGLQSIIQFAVQYRYIRNDGNTAGTEQIDFIDSNGEKKRGFFSNWNEIKTPIRKKNFDVNSGKYIWLDEEVENADSININQLDISISKGEKVEIKVKSISEAGWPMNPVESNWSEVAVVEFPNDVLVQDEGSNIIQDAFNEENRIKFQDELNSRGLDLHLNDSVVNSDKYYAHSAEKITSGFYTPEGSVINLFEKLNQIDLELNKLKDLINKAKGSLGVYLIDPKGSKIKISNNSTTNVQVGYYQDMINEMSVSDRKGAIITKVYYLGLQNTAASALELVSKFPGAFNESLPDSASSTDSYKRYGYDLAPMVVSYSDGTNIVNTNKIQPSPYQSSQLASQFIYVRKKDVGLNEDLFDFPTTDPWIEPVAPIVDVQSNFPFVWSGTAKNGSGTISEFAVHIDHPELATNDFNWFQTSHVPYPAFRHSAFFDLESSNINGKKQLQYVPVDSTPRGQYPQKFGFAPGDRYLIGKRTCGSYLYIAPNSHKDLLVNGNDSKAVREIQFGDENMIKIPVIFQFRMTDYFGAGDTDEGKVGGWNATGIYPQNLTYSKKIGLDIAIKDESLFSFDIEFTAKLKKDSLSQFNI